MSERKQPVTRGVAKVPVVMQMEALECGAASLCMVLAYYNKWLPLEQVRSACGVSRDGVNARNILVAARSYGLAAKGYKFEPEQLRDKGQFPCIIHWEFNHFVVLDGFKGDKAVINDPARGHVLISWKDFDEAFTGVCLMMEPGEDFEPSGSQVSIFSYIKDRLVSLKPVLLFTMISYAVTSVMGMIFPAFQRVFLDQLMTGLNPTWERPFLILLSVFMLLQITMLALQAVFSLRLSGKLAILANSEYMWHVLRLPMHFFSQRSTGDISLRKDANESISETMIGTLAPIMMNSVLLIVYLILMLRYNVVLSLIGVAGLVVNWFIRRWIADKRMNVSRVKMRDEAKLENATVTAIELIETIKASGAENGFFQNWAGYQASVNSQNVTLQRINEYLGLIPEAISTAVSFVILSIGMLLIINGNFPVGILTAFQALLSSFSEPAESLMDSQETIRNMRVSMERIQDVMDYPVDVTEERMQVRDDISYAKLGGTVEVKNVSFGYAPLGDPLLQNFSMKAEPGRKIAIVGSSGCGKSTVAKLLMGLYKPWEGEILYDGVPLDQVDRSVFTGSVAMVDQDITLFEDTISANIRMWDPTIKDFEEILAARDAGIHDLIMQREDGYQYKILEGGRDFSGGERQRPEIARALAQDPTILILDEATSALDAKTEYNVVNAIRDRGITCIVIAHRLSTIRDADEIIVLDHGLVVERGTHEELMAEHGAYERLVSSD